MGIETKSVSIPKELPKVVEESVVEQEEGALKDAPESVVSDQERVQAEKKALEALSVEIEKTAPSLPPVDLQMYVKPEINSIRRSPKTAPVSESKEGFDFLSSNPIIIQVIEFLENFLGMKAGGFLREFLGEEVGKAPAYKGPELSKEKLFGEDSNERLVEKGFVSHRENKKSSIEERLKQGETEIEFDIRRSPFGGLYLRHDAIDLSGSYDEERLGFDRLEDVLPLFAQYPQAKLFVDIKGGVSTAKDIVACLQDFDEKNESHLLARSTFISFNPYSLEQVRKAQEGKEHPSPFIFNYFPIKGNKAHADMLQSYRQGDSLDMSRILSVAGKENLANQMGNVAFFEEATHDFDDLDNAPRKANDHLNLYQDFPPPNILDLVRESDGYLGVPWMMVRYWSDFFVEAQEKGVKIAVFGFENFASPQKEERMAIAMGANLIITDHPTFSENPVSA